MKNSKILLIVILVVVGWIFGLFFLKNKLNEDVGLNEDLFIKIAHSYFNKDFDGVVTKKFIDWDNHGFRKIVLVNQTETREVRLDYEWQGLFEFIQVGDSISKEQHNLDMRLRRKGADTMIRLNFSNIKNSWDYIDFLNELDSIYHK